MKTCYFRLADTLTSSLKLAQPPVAVCFTDSIPESIPAHAGQSPAGCRFWQDAATFAFATSSADHALCAIGVYTHNLEPSPAQQTDLMDALKVFGDLGYVTPQDLPLIPVLASRPKHVVYAPLAQSPLKPGVVLLLVDANQSLILSEAVQQVENQNAPAMGRPACAVIPQVMNTGRAALSLGCCGARAYLDVLTDNVALFALPGANLAAYVERIAALAEANSTLSRFHQLRRLDVAAGAAPTIKESLAALGA
ncbi:MAG TPA: DUF169 domain-containing protein [Acidobacteriaceae bacterium]|nr:DUF169 domain-containing protein [Acidobacteriaceae bacterium]